MCTVSARWPAPAPAVNWTDGRVRASYIIIKEGHTINLITFAAVGRCILHGYEFLDCGAQCLVNPNEAHTQRAGAHVGAIVSIQHNMIMAVACGQLKDLQMYALVP